MSPWRSNIRESHPVHFQVSETQVHDSTLKIQSEPKKSVTLNNRGRKIFLDHARSVVLAGIVGAVLVPAAACAHNKLSPPEAMIVDQLGITDPGPEFISKVEAQLLQSGYKIDYVPPEDVLVDLYRQLPKYNSSIIVIRSHSSNATQSGNTIVNGDVALFTSQPYVTDLFVDEQRTGELLLTKFLNREQITYFAITPKFVENEMKGKFKKGATVIIMGCDGLANESLGHAFFEKGIDTYFGFDGSVSAQYTDKVTEILIRHLVVDQMTPVNALIATMEETGPDPVYGGTLAVLQKNNS